ncbi:cytochrome b/b6 domain-containing protein [Corynebacterium glutamicum]|nr:cytochrome b/b6 domain-containing protein [Corynebacterium glutamicum]MBA4578352.1 cytochrome b/b6 domain-containing protein [Corynebacterium glutamicum]MBA4581286.1 cytochrome b/b6 domain-containing protein [Corynebacterium glutamicum]MBA4587142.1 cytochrome b/b6 domain-containing protein [Corynebacterium glutamicum]MBA4590441.1 cytochrome b/b6 domain-containing protein [Corynebacterium glutamicum]
MPQASSTSPPYDALQMLGYTFVIFILAPFLILTGIAMAPAIRSRFPWYVKLFGGHQGARSLHFIAMVLMTGFVIMHVGLVFWSMATTTWSTWSSAI